MNFNFSNEVSMVSKQNNFDKPGQNIVNNFNDIMKET